MQIGWADSQFTASINDGKGAGDDSHSWAFDGYRCLKWHANQKESFGKKWKPGDVIGIAINLDVPKSVSFSLNGDWDSMGVAFDDITTSGGVYPCITLLRGERVELNLGVEQNNFAYNPPTMEYHSLTMTQEVQTEEQSSRFSGFTSVIEMGMSEQSFTVSFPGEIMVNVMGRGLDYEAKKNAIIHAGYEETLKCWEERQGVLTQNTKGTNLKKNEIFALICYTLEKPPVYRYFNNDTRKGYQGDGMDFPIISHLLREGCRKILASLPEDSRTRTVYRGVGMRFTAKVGETMRFGSYTSTTGSKEVADGFMEGNDGTQFIAKTKLGAPIKMLSLYPSEEEVLVPPYEVFKVTAIENTKPIKIYLDSTVCDDRIGVYMEKGTIPVEC